MKTKGAPKREWVADVGGEPRVVAMDSAALQSADEDGTLGFVQGPSRPWGRVAGYNGKSKYKSIKQRKSGSERLLAAANGDGGKSSEKSKSGT